MHDRERVLDYFTLVLATMYSYLVRVPKWLMYVISGGVGTFLLNFLQKPKPQDKSKVKPSAIPKPLTTPPVVTPKAEAKSTATSRQKTKISERSS